MNIPQLFFLAFFLVISLNLNGQNITTSGRRGLTIEYGGRTGFNLSTLMGQDAYNARISTGFHLGPYAKVKANDPLFFQPELLLSLKGYSARSDINGDYRERLTLYYLDLPLMLGIKAAEIFHLYFGLQPSFLLGGRYKIKYDTDDVFVTNNVEAFKGIDFGVLVGADVETETGFNFGARFNYGILTAYDNSGILAHHANLQVSVGFTFGK